MLVRKWMNKRPITIKTDDTLGDAMALMHNRSIRRLPVMDKDMLVGIVTEGDILKATPGGSVSIYEMHYLASKTKVNEIMTRKVVSVQADSLLEEAALMLRENKIGGMPVLHGERLVGMISATDILDAFLHIMGVSRPGIRVTLTVEDQPGALAQLADVVKDYGNISSIVNFGAPNNKACLVMRLSAQTGDKDAMIKAIESKGFEIQSLLDK